MPSAAASSTIFSVIAGGVMIAVLVPEPRYRQS